MSARPERLVKELEKKGIQVDKVAIDPSLPEWTLSEGAFVPESSILFQKRDCKRVGSMKWRQAD